jgi:hypothetical protein
MLNFGLFFEKRKKYMMAATLQPRNDKGRFEKIPRPENITDWLLTKKSELGIEYDYILADKLGIPANNLSRILTGKYGLSALNLKGIFDGLHIQPGSSEYFHLLDLYYKSRLDVETAWNKTKIRR